MCGIWLCWYGRSPTSEQISLCNESQFLMSSRITPGTSITGIKRDLRAPAGAQAEEDAEEYSRGSSSLLAFSPQGTAPDERLSS